MSHTTRLLELIETGVVEHGGDLGGWTQRSEDALKLFDGRITLRVEFHDAPDLEAGEAVHAHVLATLHGFEDEVLEACVMGMGEHLEGALGEAALLWVTCVAGSIKSFIDHQPVCSTVQAGVPGGDLSKGYSERDYGLPDVRAYIGPCIVRAFNNDNWQPDTDDALPWFRFAAESASPRRVHLAKATVASKGQEGWHRELEIDGHDVSHRDPDWPAEATETIHGYLTRYAVFEFPEDSPEIEQRRELDRTIRHFAEHFTDHESVDDLQSDMVRRGFDADLVDQVESFSTIAFSREYFGSLGAQYAYTVIRARRDGRVETDVPLMGIPAYSRAWALAGRLRETMSDEDFRELCLYNAESQAILQVVETAGENVDWSQIKLLPCVVPERGVSDETINAAMAHMETLMKKTRRSLARKKPWWKFW